MCRERTSWTSGALACRLPWAYHPSLRPPPEAPLPHLPRRAAERESLNCSAPRQEPSPALFCNARRERGRQQAARAKTGLGGARTLTWGVPRHPLRSAHCWPQSALMARRVEDKPRKQSETYDLLHELVCCLTPARQTRGEEDSVRAHPAPRAVSAGAKTAAAIVTLRRRPRPCLGAARYGGARERVP